MTSNSQYSKLLYSGVKKMKSRSGKIYLSRWGRQRLKIRLLKLNVKSLEAERNHLRKELEETRTELAEQHEKIYKLMREMGRLEGQLAYLESSREMKDRKQ